MTSDHFMRMVLRALAVVTAVIPLAANAESSDEEIRVQVMAFALSPIGDLVSDDFLVKLVRDNFLSDPQSRAKVSYARVKPLKFKPGDLYDHVLVMLMHSRDYGVDTARVALSGEEVMRIDYDYAVQQGEIVENERLAGTCPDDTVEAFFTCPACQESDGNVGQQGASANFYKVMAAAEAAGIKYKMFGDSQATNVDGYATSQVYYDYWSCPNLRYFSNTGHGFDGYFVTDDGEIYPQNLSGYDFTCKIIYFTSCYMYSSFESTMTQNKASWYSAGISMITMGTGDCVFGCYWDTVFGNLGSADMQQTQNSCVFQCGNQDTIGVSAPGPDPWSAECTVDDTPPTVVIAQPTGGSVFTEGEMVPVVVSATDDIELKKVDLFVDGAIQGTLSSSPFAWELTDLAAGSHVLMAEAADASDNEKQSDEVTFQVEEPAADDDDDNDNDNDTDSDTGDTDTSDDSSDDDDDTNDDPGGSDDDDDDDDDDDSNASADDDDDNDDSSSGDEDTNRQSSGCSLLSLYSRSAEPSLIHILSSFI